MPKILIADDEPLVRKGLGCLLRTAGHTVVETADADEAAAAVRHDTPDVAILDNWMPGESGIDLMRRLAASHPGLPVIIISGGGPRVPLEYSLAVAAAEGASAILVKPFEGETLLAAVTAALDRRAA